jgi:hypothetical protein
MGRLRSGNSGAIYGPNANIVGFDGVTFRAES